MSQFRSTASSPGARGGNQRAVWGLLLVFAALSAVPAQAQPLSSDATLSALTLTDGTNEAPLAPTFSPGTETYTAAMIANNLPRITVIATKNDDGANVEITPADSIPGTPDHEVDLSIGTNTITVQVTAEDGTMKSYTVTLVRAEADETPTITLVVTPSSISENGGVATVTATVSPVSTMPFTLTISAAPVSPATTADYNLSSNSRLEFAANAATSTGVVTITAVDNSVDAPDKMVTVSGYVYSVCVDGSDTATLTIEDDDGRGVTLSKRALEVAPGGSETYTAVLDTAPTGTVTVTPQVDPAVTGLTVEPASLTFTGDTWSTPQTVTVRAAANAPAGPATVTNTVTGADYGANSVTAPSVAVTVTSGGEPLVVPDASVDDARGPEAAGRLRFAVRLTEAASGTVTIDYRTRAGTATAGADFETATGTLTFDAGDTTRTIEVTLLDDTVDEVDETFDVELLNPSGANLDDATATGTIEDDDGRGVTLSERALEVAPGGSKTYTAVLDTQPTGSVTVSPQLASSVTGVTVEPAGLPFTADTWLVPQTVTVSAAADAPRGTVTVTHAVTGADYGANGVTAHPVIVTVTNDGGPGVRTLPEMSIHDVRGSEGAERLWFPVRLSQATDRTVTIDYRTRAGTATTGADFEAAAGTLTFAPGEARQTIEVPLIDDVLDEVDEVFGVELLRASGARLVDAAAIGTIEDDDAAPELRVADAAAAEDAGTIGFPVRLSSASGRPVTAAYAMRDGSAEDGRDYEAQAGRLTFAPGQTELLLTAPVLDDTVDEDDETFTLSLDGVTDAVLADGEATGTIEDNDAAPDLRVADAEVDENAGAIRFPVRLSNSSERPVTVTYAMRDGSAEDGRDYEAQAGSLTFAPGENEMLVSAPVLDDSLDEDDETFTLSLDTATHATIVVGDAVGTIRDDDVEPALMLFDSRAPEKAGTIIFPARLTVAAGRDLRYPWQTMDGDALAGADYEATQSELVIPAGETDGALEVRLVDDDLVEEEERFTVSLRNPRAPELGTLQATGFIEDDDMAAKAAKMWITRFGRTVATQVLESVEDRLSGVDRRTHVSLGVNPQARFFNLDNAARGTGAGLHDRLAPTNDVLRSNGLDILARSSFLVTGDPTDGAGRWTFWGRGTTMRFAGEDDGLAVDGEVLTTLAGFDYERGRVLAGVLAVHSVGIGGLGGYGVSRSAGDGDARSTLVTGTPYIRFGLTDRISLWGLGGYGAGAMRLFDERDHSRLTMLLGGGGVRGELRAPDSGLGLAVKSDLFWVELDAAATTTREDVVGDARRARVLLESSWAFTDVWGGNLTPHLEAGVRYDGGDAETGTGLEVGSGLSFARPDHGLRIEVTGQTLVAHQDSAYREWGVGGLIEIAPGAQERGLSVRFASSLGAMQTGVGQLWESQDPLRYSQAALGTPRPVQQDAELGYGLTPFRHTLVTPYTGLAWATDNSNAIRVGARFRLRESFSLTLEADRREQHGQRSSYSIAILGGLR